MEIMKNNLDMAGLQDNKLLDGTSHEKRNYLFFYGKRCTV